MKPEDLWSAFTELDDDLVLDTEAAAPKRKFGPRRLMAVLTAAVIASTMVLTAFASSDGAVWFKNFFSMNTDLADSQKDFIEGNTTQFRQSQTSNGYTLTLDTAISDGVRTYIRFQLTAPEGVVLDADHYAPNNWTELKFVNENGETYSTSGGWDTYDDDLTDNVSSLLYTSDNGGFEDDVDRLFEETWNVRIIGIKAGCWHDLGTPEASFEEKKLTDGLWEFDIQFPEKGNRVVELISTPVDCPSEVDVGIEKTGENTFRYITESALVQITSFKLRALTAEFSYQYSEKEQVNADFEDLYVVMKDGTRTLMHQNLGYPNYNTYYFDAPIILDEVDHILLPNGTKLRVPLA